MFEHSLKYLIYLHITKEYVIHLVHVTMFMRLIPVPLRWCGKLLYLYITNIVIWQTSKVIFLLSYYSYFRQKRQLLLAPAKTAVS